MGTVGEDGQDRDDVNDDNLDDCAPLVGLHVDGGGAVHCLQPVKGNCSPAQSGDVYRDSLRNVYFNDIFDNCSLLGNKQYKEFVNIQIRKRYGKNYQSLP